jgi:hypothetical protein
VIPKAFRKSCSAHEDDSESLAWMSDMTAGLNARFDTSSRRHLKVLVDNAGGCEHAERRFRFEKVPAERIPRSALEIHGQNIVGLRTVWLAPILDLMLLLNGKDVGIVLEMSGIGRFRRKVHVFDYYSR